jgi:hypothetical protein
MRGAAKLESPEYSMRFEKKHQPLANRTRFLKRVFLYFLASVFLMGFSLGLGILGYRYFAELSWVDSLLNASMILTGMGPVSEMRSDVAKIFASVYALFSGVIFLSATAVVLSPIFHRILHRFHLDDAG